MIKIKGKILKKKFILMVVIVEVHTVKVLVMETHREVDIVVMVERTCKKRDGRICNERGEWTYRKGGEGSDRTPGDRKVGGHTKDFLWQFNHLLKLLVIINTVPNYFRIFFFSKCFYIVVTPQIYPCTEKQFAASSLEQC